MKADEARALVNNFDVNVAKNIISAIYLGIKKQATDGSTSLHLPMNVSFKALLLIEESLEMDGYVVRRDDDDCGITICWGEK